ncbi:MAG: YggT family protein [Rubrobacteraceae bacterium]
MSLALLQEFGYSISNLLIGIVSYGYYIMVGFIIASILFSWFPGYPSSSFMQAIYDAVRAVVNPILMPIRNNIPPLRLGGFGLDLSPIIALIGLWMARRLLTTIIDIFIRPVVG